MDWFFRNGMPTIYVMQSHQEILSQPLPEPEVEVDRLGYVSDAEVQSRTVSILILIFNISPHFIYELSFILFNYSIFFLQRFRLMNMTAEGIAMVKTPGQMAFGQLLLVHSRDFLRDIGHIAMFRAMVEQAGLPFDLNHIDISGDIPDMRARHVDVQVPPTTHDDIMQGVYSSLRSIVIDGRPLADDAGPSAAAPARRQTRPARRFSHSNFTNPRGREATD